MSDYRNQDFGPYDPNDPYRAGMDPVQRPSNVVTGWVVAVVFVVAILAVIFGLSQQQPLGTNTASNDTVQHSASPATPQTTPPEHATGPASQSTASPFAGTKTPVNPMPPMPSQSSSGH